MMTKEKGILKLSLADDNAHAQSLIDEQKDRTAYRQVSGLSVLALQKQLQVLELRQLLVLGALTGIGVLSRVFIHGFSIELITFLAILAGWLFGGKRGFVVGTSALFISNFFVPGGQGIWTVFQMAGFGLAGYMGSLLRKRASVIECILVMSIATLSYEVIMNISSLLFLPQNIFLIFFLSLPFTIAHLVSNIIFSSALPKLKRYVEKKGEFNMEDVCKEMIKEIKCKIKN